MIKGCQSVQEINALPDLECFQEDLSCSLTIKESEKEVLQKKVEKGLLYDEKNMKYSVYDLSKDHEPPQEVRRTKKKFNLTSTSSTLEIFS